MNKISNATKEKLKEGGRKGGKAKVPKGFSKMPKDRLSEIGRKGGKAKRKRS